MSNQTIFNMPQAAINIQSLNHFKHHVFACKPQMQKHYQQLLAEDLSKQQWDGCFQRNVLAVLRQTYAAALTQLQTLAFDTSNVAVNQGMSDLTRQILVSFEGFVDEFLLFAVDKHRTSCALSNFPDEHKPSKTYLNQVKRESAVLWQDFALNANAYFLEY